MQVRFNEQSVRCVLALLRWQLRLVLPVFLLSFALFLVTLSGVFMTDRPLLQGVLIVMTLFTASIALCDVLEGIVYGWVPYAIDNRAYRLLDKLEVTIEVLP